MIIANLPAAPNHVGQAYMVQLLKRLSDLFRRCQAADAAAPFIILQSPDGRSWDLKVDNAGVLSTTLNTGQINPAGGHTP